MVRCCYLFFAFCCCLFVAACTVKPPAALHSTAGPAAGQPTTEDRPDLSCAYYHFLLGTWEEYKERFPEALKAYEKALACDRQAEYVNEKIPVLLLKMGDTKAATTWLAKAIADHPDNNNYRLLLANLYIQQEDVEAAIPLYNEVLAREPDNEGVLLRLALLYGHLGKNETAEEIFKKLLKNEGDLYFIHLSYARLLKQMERFPDAAKEYEKALDLNWSKEIAYELGYLYVTQEMSSDALRIFTTITEDDPFDEQAALSRTQTLLDLGRNDDALDELQNTRLYSKDPANIDLIISKVMLRNNEVAPAKKILTRLVEETGGSEARYMLALLAYQEEDYATCLAHLALIDAKSAEFEDAVYLQTRIYQKRGDLDQAIALLQKNTTGEAEQSTLFYVLLSSLYQAKSENGEALKLMETAVGIYPEDQQLLFEYGLVLEKNGSSDQAMKIMQKVLELEPDHAEALNYIGYTWADKNINLEKALEYLKRANTLKPDNGFIIDSLGWVYFRLGDLRQAVRELERSSELVPDDPHIFDHLGDVYRALNRPAKARRAYQKAYEMFKDEKDKADIKQKIDALDNR